MINNMDNNIYDSARLYDDIHWWKKNDMNFWSNIYKETKSRSVLELAAGTGRLAHVFLQEGAYYTGLEINQNFVLSSQKKILHYGERAHMVCGNMCDFDLKEKYDLICIGFNSFLHLLTDKDANRCLSCIKKHMHKKSRLIIDIYVPNPLFLYRPKNMFCHVLEYNDSLTKQHVFVEETNEYDSTTDINKLTWYFSTKLNKHFDKKHFYVRMYFPSTMNKLLIDANFNIKHQWGNYDKAKLNVDSKLQIYTVMLK